MLTKLYYQSLVEIINWLPEHNLCPVATGRIIAGYREEKGKEGAKSADRPSLILLLSLDRCPAEGKLLFTLLNPLDPSSKLPRSHYARI